MSAREIENVICKLLKPINEKLDDLPTKSDFESLSKSLNLKVEHVKERIAKVERQVNDVQQYIRRYDLRIFNVPIDDLETQNISDWVLNYFTQRLKVDISEESIDRAHRVGRVKDGKTQIIVRFISWSPRCKVFRNRKNGKHPISVDLTQENLSYFKAVKDLLRKNPGKAEYAFVDINCRIGIKMKDDSLLFPSSLSELDTICNRQE